MVGWISFFLIIIILLICDYVKQNKYVYPIISFIIIVFAGFRYNLGYDYDNYVEIYKEIKLKLAIVEGIEYGWKVITYIAIWLKSPQVVFLLSSIIIYGLILFVIKKESDNWKISIIIFLFVVFYYWESMGIIRQYMAIAIFVYSVKYIYNKNLKKYIILILIGSLFHNSILLASPVYFLSRIRYKKIVMYIMVGSSSLIAIIFSNFIMMLDFMSKYQTYLNGGIVAEGKENSGLSIIIRMGILFIVIFFKDKIGYKNDIRRRVFINLYFFGTLFFITFYSSTAIRRIGYYFMIFEIFVIPMIILMRVKRNYVFAFVKYNFIGCYMLYTLSTFNNDILSRSIKIDEDSQKNRHYEMNFIGSFFDRNIGD